MTDPVHSTNGEMRAEAPPIITGQTWEDMTVGTRFRTASRTVTETDLVNFITLCGFNEPLFWDASHARAAGYAGRLVPGALTVVNQRGEDVLVFTPVRLIRGRDYTGVDEVAGS